MDCPEGHPYLGCCVDILKVAQIFVFCFLQRPKCLGLFLFSRFLACDRFVQFYIVAVHGLSCRFLDPSENGLADGVTVLRDQEILVLPEQVSWTDQTDGHLLQKITPTMPHRRSGAVQSNLAENKVWMYSNWRN